MAQGERVNTGHGPKGKTLCWRNHIIQETYNFLAVFSSAAWHPRSEVSKQSMMERGRRRLRSLEATETENARRQACLAIAESEFLCKLGMELGGGGTRPMT